jgi:hypothetical protein
LERYKCDMTVISAMKRKIKNLSSRNSLFFIFE